MGTRGHTCRNNKRTEEFYAIGPNFWTESNLFAIHQKMIFHHTILLLDLKVLVQSKANKKYGLPNWSLQEGKKPFKNSDES